MKNKRVCGSHALCRAMVAYYAGNLLALNSVLFALRSPLNFLKAADFSWPRKALNLTLAYGIL
jgi:hypothetical protein